MPTLTFPHAGERYLSTFERAERDRANEPAWLRAARRAAADAFRRTGFPTTRDEEWRFTNIAPIADTPFDEAPDASTSAEQASPFILPGLAGPVMVFINGRYASDLSHAGAPMEGLTIATLANAFAAESPILARHFGRTADFAGRPLAALNTALFEDGVLVSIDDDTTVASTIQVVFLSTVTSAAAMSHPRVLVTLGRNSSARVIETFGSVGPVRGFTNAVSEIVLDDGAVLDHYRLQRESEHAYHIGRTEFRLGRSSSSSSHAIAIGGLISRHDTVAVLGGQGADCTLNGLYLGDGVRLVDNHTDIDHATPGGTSHQLYKGILDGRARGVFNGRIRVRPDAQKTDAKQTNKTLLLSDEAQVNTKPQLEIFANDVKCTHGATVGQLSEDAMFYLRARGIDREAARSLLVRAFATDVTGRIGLAPVRAEVDRLLAARLPGRLEEQEAI